MKNIKANKVLPYIIFLIVIFLKSNEIYGSNYEAGTNIIEREIYFRVIVEDSLDIEAEDTYLNFGEILKGSTDKREIKTNIDIKASKNISHVSLRYDDSLVENQEDGSKKFKIMYVENTQDKDKKQNKKEINIEKEEIDVYFSPFKDNYKLEIKEDRNRVLVPVIAEIRGVEGVKVGKYEGTMKVEIIAVTNNEKERE